MDVVSHNQKNILFDEGILPDFVYGKNFFGIFMDDDHIPETGIVLKTDAELIANK